MELIETPIFTRQVTGAMDDDEYRLFQLHLMQQPDAGDTIRGSGGLRKIRWRLPGRGKRGGARIIYAWKARRSRHVRSDLTPAQLRVLRSLIVDE